MSARQWGDAHSKADSARSAEEGGQHDSGTTIEPIYCAPSTPHAWTRVLMRKETSAEMKIAILAAPRSSDTTRRGRALGLCAVLVLLILLLTACGTAETSSGAAANPASTTAATATATPAFPSATIPAKTIGVQVPTAASPTKAAARPAATPATPSIAPATAHVYAIVPGPSRATYKAKETFVGQGLSEATGTTTAV